MLLVKNRADKVFKDMAVQEEMTAKVAGRKLARHAAGTFLKKRRYLVQCVQWVLGEDVQLPGFCAEFWHRFHLQENCEVAFHKTANSPAQCRDHEVANEMLLNDGMGQLGLLVVIRMGAVYLQRNPNSVLTKSYAILHRE